MAILGMFEDDDYLPESSTLIVRDVGAYERRGPFSQHGSKVQPCGTIVRTGNGWLEGSAGPGPDVVRLEVHDSAPADDTADWADVVDIPYRSLSGKMGLDYVTGGSGGDVFAHAGAGAYRVRVTRRRIDEDAWNDRWLLRFWPAEPAPPRWLKRRETAVRPAETGWYNVFGHEFSDLLRAVEGTREDFGDATIESLRQFGVQWNRGADWLDRPLSGRVPILMHPSDVARQLGMPEPGTLADTLDVFVAVGALVEDGNSYRKPAVQPNPEDVIDMSDRHRIGLSGSATTTGSAPTPRTWCPSPCGTARHRHLAVSPTAHSFPRTTSAPLSSGPSVRTSCTSRVPSTQRSP